mmetsp:Transcript_29628/g.74087  ORF Transcript_29628/g.74087 Transcript_29628/m.74087 type:complete len:124 (-) Transcript_29628:879-1250(-)
MARRTRTEDADDDDGCDETTSPPFVDFLRPASHYGLKEESLRFHEGRMYPIETIESRAHSVAMSQCLTCDTNSHHHSQHHCSSPSLPRPTRSLATVAKSPPSSIVADGSSSFRSDGFLRAFVK